MYSVRQKAVPALDAKSGEIPVCIIGIFLFERSMEFPLDGSVRIVAVFYQLLPIIPHFCQPVKQVKTVLGDFSRYVCLADLVAVFVIGKSEESAPADSLFLHPPHGIIGVTVCHTSGNGGL